jgi:transcriptional/translational regulatory protein YebC/TACO1
VRSYFSKYGGNMGETGCVGWMFKERGEVSIKRESKISEDDIMLQALDAGADDLETSDEETITVICEPAKLEQVLRVMKDAGYKVTDSQVVMSPLSTVEITDEENARNLLRLLDALENQDDVQNVYANFDMDQKYIDKFMP